VAARRVAFVRVRKSLVWTRQVPVANEFSRTAAPRLRVLDFDSHAGMINALTPSV